MWFLKHIVSPLMGVLLRSPLHRLLSGALMLVTYTGQRSGRRFTTPVSYVRQGQRIFASVGMPNKKQWWRNLQRPSQVSLRLRGDDTLATARTFTGAAEPALAAEALGAIVGRFPSYARSLGLERNPSGEILPESLRAKAAGERFVVFELG